MYARMNAVSYLQSSIRPNSVNPGSRECRCVPENSDVEAHRPSPKLGTKSGDPPFCMWIITDGSKG